MSKINKIRLVNLNYNNNTMRIEDESFYLDGENTMLNLRNGGGKSVIVQMVMAPFVSKRYRRTNDRTFESYFTSPTPTYILVEWKLDDGAGYFLTAMMVRKKEGGSDENSKDKLDIINFVHEYKSRNSYDIDSIPIIEEKENGRVIKSFANSKKLFEDLKKNRDIKFNYYDMNNSLIARNYFNKLEEYKINHREWETIVRQVNLKESGLSELFNKAKDSTGLVRDWFLPAIENKLKKDEDRIDNYRELVNRYIKQYRANKFNIDKKTKIELFKILSEELFIVSDIYINTLNKKEELENYIANSIFYLKKELNFKEMEEIRLEGLLEKFLNEIKELNYEKNSIEIYEKEDRARNLVVGLETEKETLKEREYRKNNLKRKINILKCAKIHREYQESSEVWQRYDSELKVLSEKNKDTAPYINNLGFTIKNFLEKDLEEAKKNNLEHRELEKVLEEENNNIINSLKSSRAYINSLREQRGSLSSKIYLFNNIEEEFNKEFEDGLFRNISGYFDNEKLISIGKNIDNEKIQLSKERKTLGENLVSIKDSLKSKESERNKNTRESAKTKESLDGKILELKKAEEEIKNRIEIIKYIDFEKEKIFNIEDILRAFNKKIDLLKEEENTIRRILDSSLKEVQKLKTGKVLDLPKEIEKKLKEKDINIVYGMEWLKKNEYSKGENEKLIKKNPFIPYSLIMSSKEIEILQKEALDLFTSSPISIINRADIEGKSYDINGNILTLETLRFLIAFNNKLIDEEELLSLVEKQELNIEEIRKKLNNKSENIEFYEDKRNTIKYSYVTEMFYKELKNEIEELTIEDNNLRIAEIDLEKEISEIKVNIENNESTLKGLEKEFERNILKEKKFKALKECYENYCTDKKNSNILEEKLTVIEKDIHKNEKRSNEILKELKECSEKIRFYSDKEKKVSRELVNFSGYALGELILKDREDLTAEYNALIKEITSTEEELREKARLSAEKFKSIEEELLSAVNNYGIKESEYINESYDRYKFFELEKEFNKEEESINNLKESIESLNIKVEVIKSQIKDLYRNLKNDFAKGNPKNKELLVFKDFKEEIAKINLEIKDTNKVKKEMIKLKGKISNNLSGLNEYTELIIIETINLDFDFSKLDETIGKLKRDLTNIKDEGSRKERELRNLVLDIEDKEEFRNETFFKESIGVIKSLTNNPREFKTQLNVLIDSYNRIIGKLMADIELIEKEENKMLESILEYVKDVHENIEKIDDNSSIKIGTRRVKMLMITAGNWEKNKEIYKIRLKNYVEQIRNQSINALEKNEDIEDIISNKVNINKLYDEIVGVSSINIKLYKIEEDKEKKITWDEVSKNSGGEGFLSAFVILSSLLSYMRKDENDIFNRKESGKVLIMDNPFAQTSSAHLLKPLIDIAKKSNTQLICLTGLGGDSIYNRFDNIYVLNLISSQLRSGVKYLRSEHTKGEEERENEVMVASRFKIESEQTRLF